MNYKVEKFKIMEVEDIANRQESGCLIANNGYNQVDHLDCNLCQGPD